MSEHPADRSLTALYDFVSGQRSLNDTLERIATVTVESLAADMGSVTLIDQRGRPVSAVCTSDETAEVDHAQYDADSGPCLDAFRQRHVVRVDAVESEVRWPQFVEAASAHGIGSSLSLPLLVSGEGLGSLNLYAYRPSGFDEAAEAFGQAFAAQATIGIAYWQKASLAEHLSKALESRAVIEQAKGVIMASSGCGPDEAFELLRQQSQTQNIKLRDVATEIVQQQQRNRG